MSNHHCGATHNTHTHKQKSTPLPSTGGRPRTQIQIGKINLHTLIDTGNHPPIKSNPYRMPFSKREIVEQEIDSMLKQGVIRPSHSPWASPITLVPKKDGSTRFCVDYRKLNTILNTTAYPLPHTRDVLDQLQGAVLFSALDLRSGYWQLPMDEKSIPKTAFTSVIKACLSL